MNKIRTHSVPVPKASSTCPQGIPKASTLSPRHRFCIALFVAALVSTVVKASEATEVDRFFGVLRELHAIEVNDSTDQAFQLIDRVEHENEKNLLKGYLYGWGVVSPTADEKSAKSLLELANQLPCTEQQEQTCTIIRFLANAELFRIALCEPLDDSHEYSFENTILHYANMFLFYSNFLEEEKISSEKKSSIYENIDKITELTSDLIFNFYIYSFLQRNNSIEFGDVPIRIKESNISECFDGSLRTYEKARNQMRKLGLEAVYLASEARPSFLVMKMLGRTPDHEDFPQLNFDDTVASIGRIANEAITRLRPTFSFCGLGLNFGWQGMARVNDNLDECESRRSFIP